MAQSAFFHNIKNLSPSGLINKTPLRCAISLPLPGCNNTAAHNDREQAQQQIEDTNDPDAPADAVATP